MNSYDFEVLKGEATSYVERNVAISDMGSLWVRIGAIASRHGGHGTIKVTDEQGGIVVLVGVVSATRLCELRVSRNAYPPFENLDGTRAPLA